MEPPVGIGVSRLCILVCGKARQCFLTPVGWLFKIVCWGHRGVLLVLWFDCRLSATRSSWTR